jgi:alpha-galactosidase
MSFKIAFVGAGSIGFTRGLLRDLLAVPEFKDIEVAFQDISKQNLDMVTQLAQRDIDSNGLKITIESTVDRRKAIKGAKYIFCVARVGGLEAFKHDVEIPLKYGIDQCVGDTICAGGVLYGQRGINFILDVCKDIREVGAENSLLLNYSNPMAQLTWAANAYGGVRCVGLCHGVQGGHWQITSCVDQWAKREGLIGKDESVKKKDVDIICAGINHQTWYVKAQWRGIDLIPKMLELFEGHSEYPKTEKVRIDMLRRFGYYSTESNGHLSEYVPWYRKRPGEIERWIDLGCWINGETGGYLRVCTEGRNWFETDFPNWMKGEPMKFTADKRGEEHGSYIVEGLETGRVYRGHFNVVNNGCITNLPPDAIVEVPGYVDKNGMNIPKVGDLPLGCAAVCTNSINVQRLAVKAAVTGDAYALKQAVLLDPLTGAVCNPPEVWQMVDEMIVAQEQWLPQYKAAIAEAKKTIAKAKKDGTWIKTNEGYQGAARLHTKTVAEMKANRAAANANAGESDKAKSRPAADKKKAG